MKDLKKNNNKKKKIKEKHLIINQQKWLWLNFMLIGLILVIMYKNIIKK